MLVRFRVRVRVRVRARVRVRVRIRVRVRVTRSCGVDPSCNNMERWQKGPQNGSDYQKEYNCVVWNK